MKKNEIEKKYYVFLVNRQRTTDNGQQTTVLSKV